MRGKLIVLDGLDGSGKSTQTKLLYDAVKSMTDKVMLLSYPDYADPSSALVSLYLNGELSENVSDINAYAASSFYAVDRYASYMRYWKEKYESGWIILASRYVSSNAIHQMVKLPQPEWRQFLNWLDDYEYGKLGLPRPDRVLFLDMDRNAADRLIMDRYDGDESKKDIHEKDREYLVRCTASALFAAQQEHWEVIPCCSDAGILPVEEIAANILTRVKEVI